MTIGSCPSPVVGTCPLGKLGLHVQPTLQILGVLPVGPGAPVCDPGGALCIVGLVEVDRPAGHPSPGLQVFGNLT